MTHVAVRSTQLRKNQLMETVHDMQVGDLGETLVAMNVRAEIEHKSDIIGSMPEGCQFTVFETGEHHRILISSGNVTGWISSSTELGQPLTKKVKAGTGALAAYECEVQLHMKENMEFTSKVLMSLPPGTQFEVIEEGPQNRVKVFVHDEDGEANIGWITAKTELDQPLIKALNAQENRRLGKNLDTYIAKQLSKAEIRHVVSFTGERPMGNTLSTASNAGVKQAKAPGQTKEKAPQEALKKLACCCGS